MVDGPAFADGPSCFFELLSPGPAILLMKFIAPVDGIILHGFDRTRNPIARSEAREGARDRLVLRVENAGSLAEVMLQSVLPVSHELLIETAELWRLASDCPPAHVLRPTSLDEPDWSARAYGAPADDDTALLRWLAWASVKVPTPVAWWGGSRLILYPQEALSTAIARTGAYEPETTAALKRLLTRDAVFLDAGANSGVFSLPASRRVGPKGLVISVEPSTREQAKLRANIELNGVRNIRLVEHALGAEPGRARLLIGDAVNAGLNTLGPALAHEAEAISEQIVTVTTLDRLCTEMKLERLDLIKADVEGWEIDLLIGGRSTIERFRPALIIEVEDSVLEANGREVGDLERILEEMDYRVFSLSPSADDPVLLTTIADFVHGNIMAIPAERSEEWLRRSDETRRLGLSRQILEQLTASNYDAKQERARRAREDQYANAQENVAGRSRAGSDSGGTLEERIEAGKVELERLMLANGGPTGRLRTAFEALDDSQHEIHQLKSQVLQQRSALDDDASQLEEAKAALSASKLVLEAERATSESTALALAAEREAAQAGALALEDERSAARTSALALAEMTQARISAEERVQDATNANSRLEKELQEISAAHVAEMADRDNRVASVLKAVNARQMRALARAAEEREQAVAVAEQSRDAVHAELRVAEAQVRNLTAQIEAETSALKDGLRAARERLEAIETDFDVAQNAVERLDAELRDRNRLIAMARAAPFRFFLHRVWIWLLRNILRPLSGQRKGLR